MADVTDAQVEAVPGWLEPYDVDLFRLLLTATAERLGPGDLAELGVFQGRSAVLIGAYLGQGETFTVVDLFGGVPATPENQAEVEREYAGLDRTVFERNYRALHGDLPTIVEGLSQTIVDHAARGAHRFVHVDASHRYEHVVGDLDAARSLLAPGGVVVLDDYRSEHTPGVAAAAWAAVAGGGLQPFALSPVKMYATFDDPTPWYDRVVAWASATRWAHETQTIAGRPVCRIWWEPSPARAEREGRVRARLRRALR